jgi:Protein of unknown function (DUF1761)
LFDIQFLNLKTIIMNKKILIGGIAGGILFFLLGWLVYGILLMDYMNQHAGLKGNVNRGDGDMKMIYIFAGSVMQGILLAYVLVKANVSSVVQGFVTGAILGFLISSSVDLSMYGTTYILSKHSILADVIAATAITAVTGAVVLLIINASAKKN